MKKKLTKQNKKYIIREVIQHMNELITDGINIKKQADPDFLSEENAVLNLKRKESLWYEDVKKLWSDYDELYKICDIRALFNLHSIIPILGGLEYRDPESKKSQEVLEKIRINTDKISNFLYYMPKKRHWYFY